MTRHPDPERVSRALTPAPPPTDRPARFERWPEDITTRAYELWSTVAARSAPRTEHLLAQEAEERASPYPPPPRFAPGRRRRGGPVVPMPIWPRPGAGPGTSCRSGSWPP